VRKFFVFFVFFSLAFLPALSHSQVYNLLNENFDGAWGTYGDNPPSGWRIYGGGSEPIPTWNGNDWFRQSSGGSGGSACAEIRYNPQETSDDSLISPTVSFSPAASACSLSFWTMYNWDNATPDEGYVLGSTDGGATWITIDHFTADVFYPSGGYKYYDITSWAKGQSVIFSFWYHTNYGYQWDVDNVRAWEIVYYNHDVGTTSILSPVGNVGSALSFAVSARVKNFGTNTETFNVTAEIGSFSTVATVTSLGTGTQTTVNFPDQWVPPDSGTYQVKVYTQLAGDEYAVNDTAKTSTRVLTHEVGLTAIVSPLPGGRVSGKPQTAKAKVKNFGTNIETFDVKAEIGTFSSTALVGSLTPGTEITITFPDSWTPDTSGTYNMKFYTQLLTDQKPSNDTAKAAVKVWKAYQDLLLCLSINLLTAKDSAAYCMDLAALGLTYDLWNRWGTTGNEELPPDLYQWKTIIFGYSVGTGFSLNDAQDDSIIAWLNSGTKANKKNLFLDLDDLGYGLGIPAATAKDSLFYFQYLRASFLGEATTPYIYGTGDSISFGTDTLKTCSAYTDLIKPNLTYPGAQPVFTYKKAPADSSDIVTMLKYSDSTYSVVYLPLRWYQMDNYGDDGSPIYPSASRQRILRQAFSWFGSMTYKCGDANHDSKVTISDVVYLVSFLFKGGPPPNPMAAGNVNCDSGVTISDVVYLVNYLFKGGNVPCYACGG